MIFMRLLSLFGMASEMLADGVHMNDVLVEKRPDPVIPAVVPPAPPVAEARLASLGRGRYGPAKPTPSQPVVQPRGRTDMIVGGLGIGASALPFVTAIINLLADYKASSAGDEGEVGKPNAVNLSLGSDVVSIMGLAQSLILDTAHIMSPKNHSRTRRETHSDLFLVSDFSKYLEIE